MNSFIYFRTLAAVRACLLRFFWALSESLSKHHCNWLCYSVFQWDCKALVPSTSKAPLQHACRGCDQSCRERLRSQEGKDGAKGWRQSFREGCWSMKVSAVKYFELICFSVHDSPPLIAKDKCFCLWGEGLCVMFTNSGSAACGLTLLRMVTTNFK